MLKKVNVNLLHSIHINMPNNITDVRLLKIKTVEESLTNTNKADKKIVEIVSKIKSGKKIKMGMRFYSWTSGFFTQRIYGYYFYNKLRSKLKINDNLCISCNKCVEVCPTDNLEMIDKKIIADNNCTVCYRCVNICPTQAIVAQ